jgi:hypothetical protein
MVLNLTDGSQAEQRIPLRTKRRTVMAMLTASVAVISCSSSNGNGVSSSEDGFDCSVIGFDECPDNDQYEVDGELNLNLSYEDYLRDFQALSLADQADTCDWFNSYPDYNTLEEGLWDMGYDARQITDMTDVLFDECG